MKSWGGKENGLDLVKCCLYTELHNFPAPATAVNFEYTIDTSNPEPTAASGQSISTSTSNLGATGSKTLITKHVRLERVHTVSFFFNLKIFQIAYRILN